MNGVRRAVLVLLAVFACAVFVNPYLRGDGNGYFAYVRSAVIDRDLHFENEFQRGDPAFKRAVFGDGTREPTRTADGNIRNQWSVGASLVWTPFFLAAHAVVKVSGRWPADGFSFPYRWACAVGTALTAALGLLLAYRVATRATDERAAKVAVLVVLGASSLAVYMFFLPFWGLAIATLPAAALLLLWSRGRSWSWRRWFAFGTLVGLATTIHPLGIAWLALLAVAWLGDGGTLRERCVTAVGSAGGFVVAEIPQMVVRAIAHGSPFDVGYDVEWDFLSPPILDELLANQHGLFTWTPIAAVAVAGLVLLYRREAHRRLAIGLLATFVALLYLSAAYITPEQSSFGNRMFVHFTPGFVVGVAAAMASVRIRRRAAVHVGLAGLVVWNVLFAFQWAWGMLPKRGPVDWSDMARQQFTTAPREIGHVAMRFFTDRDGLIQEVQERDEARIQAGAS